MQQLKDDICYYKLVLAYRNSCIQHFFFVINTHDNSCHKRKKMAVRTLEII